MADKDHNYSIASAELKQIVERIEELESEKKDISAQIKEVYAEAKGRGYDTKALRGIVGLRKKDPDEVAEYEAILDMYKAALGLMCGA